MKHPTPEQLSAFHDGIADAKTLVSVEMHLNQCPECHEELATLERQDRALTRALTYDPGDEHLELLAARIERKLGSDPRGARAPSAAGALRGVAGALAAFAARAGSAVRGWLEGLMGAAGKIHAPEWAGALAALLVGLGLVLLNVKHSPGPALRDYTLEQRAGQTAAEPREADEARDGAPAAGALAGRESARDEALRATPPSAERVKKDAVRSVQPPAITTAPPAAAASKQEAPASRAQLVRRTPSGEEEPVRQKTGAFAKAPPATPGEKPRRALPLEESQPKVESATRSSVDAKEADRVRRRNESGLTAAEKSAPPFPTAVLPPEPEAPRSGAAGGAAARESGTRPSPASLAEPQSPKQDVRGEQGTIRTCGGVRDSRGRPISSATVTLVRQGTGVSTDAQGRFCIEAPPGDQTISVIAVGFGPLQFDVHIEPGTPSLVLTLLAVSVLEWSQALRGSVQTLGGKQQTGAPGELLPGFPDSLQPVASRAIRLTLEAERAKSAPRYEWAAAEWERVRDRGEPGSLQLEARFRIAEARYHAWELAPSARRASAANEALTSYLVRAPLGSRRNTASGWLGRVKP